MATDINLIAATPDTASLVFTYDASGNGSLHMGDDDFSLALGSAGGTVTLGAAGATVNVGNAGDIVKIHSDAIWVGEASDALGFYGLTTPITKPTLATNDAAGIITALVALGLITAAE